MPKYIPDKGDFAAMVDQIKSVDFRARMIQFMEKAPLMLMRENTAILDAIIE